MLEREMERVLDTTHFRHIVSENHANDVAAQLADALTE